MTDAADLAVTHLTQDPTHRIIVLVPRGVQRETIDAIAARVAVRARGDMWLQLPYVDGARHCGYVAACTEPDCPLVGRAELLILDAHVRIDDEAWWRSAILARLGRSSEIHDLNTSRLLPIGPRLAWGPDGMYLTDPDEPRVVIYRNIDRMR